MTKTTIQTDNKRTNEQRAEDAAYTINHAFACTATDLAGPFISAGIQKKFNKHVPIGCGESHTLGEWFIGEAIGDFGAVPITIGLQSHAPKFMGALRKIIEPVLGPFFGMGAKRAARNWAMANDMLPDSKEAKEREQHIYNYEMEHLPQAAVWTATSVAVNIGAQKLLHPLIHKHNHAGHDHHQSNHGASLLSLLVSKLAGLSLSLGLVVGGRAAFPGTAHRWDRFAAKNVFLPATKAVSGVFGIDRQAVERLDSKEDEVTGGSWEKRVSDKSAASQAVSR